MLRIKELSSYEEFSRMKEVWGNLIARSNVDNIFLTHEWMDSYIRNCCNGNRLIILTVFDGDTLVGIAPLMIRKYNFMGISAKSVCFIGTTASDRMDFILDGHKEKCVISIMDYLMGIKNDWDFVDFQEIPRSSGTMEIIEKWVNLQGLKFISGPWGRSFFIKLDYDLDFPLQKICKKLHRKMKKSNKKVLANLQFRRYIHSEIKESLFHNIQFISKRSWKGIRQKSVFLKEDTRDFHKAIFLEFPRSGCLDISILRTNNTPVAYMYNFLYNSRIYNYSIEFDARYSYLSPGTMLTLWNIEDSISRGIKEIDFGRGEEEWKTRLTQDFRMQTRARIFNNSFYGNGLYVLHLGLKYINLRFKYIKENIKKNRTIYRILRKVKRRFL